MSWTTLRKEKMKMKMIKNGKIVLDGTLKEEDLEHLLLRALEIVVDKNVDVWILKHTNTYSEYNDMRNPENHLSEMQFNIVKEITL